MNSVNDAKLIAGAQDALKGFLATVIGSDAPLLTENPQPTTLEDTRSAFAARTTIIGRISGGDTFLVALDDRWLPVLSSAMLGEELSLESEGAEDLLREIAGQGYGAVRTELSGSGIKLGDVDFQIHPAGSELPDGILDDMVWEISFSMKHGDGVMTGFFVAARTPEVARPSAGEPVAVQSVAFPSLGQENLGDGGGPGGNFNLLAEVELEITVELGRRKLPLADMLRLTNGSVIELEKLVGEPLEVYANGRLIAEGEAVVIDEQFGIRVTNLASNRHRYKAFL